MDKEIKGGQGQVALLITCLQSSTSSSLLHLPKSPELPYIVPIAESKPPTQEFRGDISYSNSNKAQYFFPAVTDFYNLSSPNTINPLQAGSVCALCSVRLCYYVSLNTLPTHHRQIPISKCQLDLTSPIKKASLTLQPTQKSSFSNLW